jgi:hypothetical protein
VVSRSFQGDDGSSMPFSGLRIVCSAKLQV